MALERSQVAQLRRPGRIVVAVGALADAGAEYLNASTGVVRISSDCLRHILEDHPDLTDLDIISMSYGLKHGLFVSQQNKPNCLMISYVHPDSGVRYKIAVKATAAGRELWVSTFHRMKPRQTRALLKRGVIIKKHTF